jgi:predicted small secreted protein
MSVKPLPFLIAAVVLASLAACSTNTVQGVKQDAHLVKEKAIEVKDKVVGKAIEVKDVVVDKSIEVKDKTVEGSKAAGQAVGSGLEKAGEAVKGATN